MSESLPCIAPSQTPFDLWRRAENPHLKLWIKDNDLRSVTPAVGGQPLPNLLRERIRPQLFFSAPLVVEHHDGMPVLVEKLPQEAVRFTSAAGIPSWMNINLRLDVANPKSRRATQQPTDAVLNVLVCDQ